MLVFLMSLHQLGTVLMSLICIPGIFSLPTDLGFFFFFFPKAILNHETYILDLVEANKGNVKWKLEYSAKV